MHPSLQNTHGRSRAAHSGQTLLSCPSSLLRPLRHPSARNGHLAGCTRLGVRLPPSENGGARGTSGLPPSSVRACCQPTRVPIGAFALSPTGTGLPLLRRGSACIQLALVYPATGLSQLSPSGLNSRGCTVRFMLRPALLASTPDWVRPAPLQNEPSRCRVEACSTAVLPRQPASCLHTHKGTWCGDLLSDRKMMVSRPRTRSV
jgi:hypothetical protein